MSELTAPEAFTVALELAKWQRDEPMQSECRCGRPMHALADMCLDCEAKFTTDGEWEQEQDL